jgi:hypothetical protein
VSKNQTRDRIKPTSVVYWLRFLLAIAAGFANNILQIKQTILGDLAIFAFIGLGLIFHILSIVVVKFCLKYGEAELKGKHQYVTLGGGTFIALWIWVAVLLNTLSGASHSP